MSGQEPIPYNIVMHVDGTLGDVTEWRVISNDITLYEWLRLCFRVNATDHMRLELMSCLVAQGFMPPWSEE